MISAAMKDALTMADEDRLIYDLGGIQQQYDQIHNALPEVDIRFAMKAGPVDQIIRCLRRKGAGFDAASPNEIIQALSNGTDINRVHYGNTIKSDQQILHAYWLGIRDFATDSMEDVSAIARNAPGVNVFCRLCTTGNGALWGLSKKFGCSQEQAIQVMLKARELGVNPAGLSVHIGSQQMQASSWHETFSVLEETVGKLRQLGISLDYINLGGGLPALGYLDKTGSPLTPSLNCIFQAMQQGMARLNRVAGKQLKFIVEPGRFMVADHGAIRAHVSRLTLRKQLDGSHQYWLYLSCGKFNGLYETDELRYRLVFPHHSDQKMLPAVVAGPTCDSDDVFCFKHNLIDVPASIQSGDPVWVLSCGAYASSYSTQGFNGFAPLPISFTQLPVAAQDVPPIPSPQQPLYVNQKYTASVG